MYNRYTDKLHSDDVRKFSTDLISINWRTLFVRIALQFMALSLFRSVHRFFCSEIMCECLLKIEMKKIFVGRLMLEIGSNNCLKFITLHYTLRTQNRRDTHAYFKAPHQNQKTENSTTNWAEKSGKKWDSIQMVNDLGLELKLKHLTLCVCVYYDSFRAI